MEDNLKIILRTVDGDYYSCNNEWMSKGPQHNSFSMFIGDIRLLKTMKQMIVYPNPVSNDLT